MRARHVIGLCTATLLAAALLLGWTGFALGPLEWAGAGAVIGDTWAWDLRWPLLPVYVAAVLWAAEKLGTSGR